MFGISYETWKDVCNMYLFLSDRKQKASLQWFPFSRLSDEEKANISGRDFFDKYIQTGGFVLFPEVMRHSENYIQKGDGSFRNAVLLSPILYLVLQSIGKEISLRYDSERPECIGVYYAGNYEKSRPSYKKDYDDFFKAVNAGKEHYQYYIKTDVTDFFVNINVNVLMDRINYVCNKDQQTISQTQLFILKELLSYCGNGYYPLIENSMASSYMATEVYFDQIDCELYDFLNNKVPDIYDFQMIRYVDDLYILFSSEKCLDDLTQTYNTIKGSYSSILKKYGLSLNVRKCSLNEIGNINEDIKRSLYDEYVNGIENEIAALFEGRLEGFLTDVYKYVNGYGITNDKYNQLILDHFSIEDVEFTAREVYNYLVYESQNEMKRPEVTSALVRIINRDVSFLSIDPKRLAVMVMRSGNDSAVRSMLNQLFIRYRAGLWNSYDTTIAIAYLIQSKFQHIDLLSILQHQNPDLYAYYWYCCRINCVSQVDNEKCNRYLRCLVNDTKAFFLYFMSCCENNRCNYLGTYAYYKNFFDRISADMAHLSGADGGSKKVNYRSFYKEGSFKKLYDGIANSESIIEKAHELRNANPLSHSSAGLIDSNSSIDALQSTIRGLDYLIDMYSLINNL